MIKHSIVCCIWLHCLVTICQAAKFQLFIGTGSKDSQGIYQATWNSTKGRFSKPELAAKIEKPSFLALSSDRKFLYSLGKQNGVDSVSSFAVDGAKLTLLNHQPIGDGGGAHLAIHPNGKFLLTAQYGGGSVAVFPLLSDGKLAARSQLIEHQGGSKVFAKRQDTPHPHWVGFSQNGSYALVPDLGLDQTLIYKIKDNGELVQQDKATSVPGSGPRHMRFSIDGKFIHLLEELTLSVTTFAFDQDKGTANMVGSTPTLSAQLKEKEKFNSASEILVHPNGKFLYTGNRGHDSVSVFSCDPITGVTQLIEVEPIRGSWPRNISLSPNGEWLIAAGTHSNTLSAFAVDPDSGELTFIPKSLVNLPGPSCILFVPKN